MTLIAISDLIGRFHPVVVHLPIGFLLLGVLFILSSKTTRFSMLKPAIGICFGAGTAAALLAVITGYVLSSKGDYDEDLLASHQWMGYVTTLISAAAWLLFSVDTFRFIRLHKFTPWIAALLVLVAVSYTGHLGGSLTHGEEYLSLSTPEPRNTTRTRDLNQALVFRDLVQPILDDKCGSCHNSSKKKGKLSIASIESLLKGGKHGLVVKSGDALASEMIKRINLPTTDKKFMPADEKPALTPAEHRIVTWWVQTGVSSTDRKLTAQKLPDSIRADVATFFTSTDTSDNLAASEATLQAQFASIAVKPITPAMIDDLKAKGFAVRIIHYAPDLLDVRMLAAPDSTRQSVGERLAALVPVSKQVLWLNLQKTGLADQDLQTLNAFVNLQRLNISNNALSDRGLATLKGFDFLQMINLAGTTVSAASVNQLSFKELRSVYVWRTAIKSTELNAFAGRSFKVIGESNVTSHP